MMHFYLYALFFLRNDLIIYSKNFVVIFFVSYPSNRSLNIFFIIVTNNCYKVTHFVNYTLIFILVNHED